MDAVAAYDLWKQYGSHYALRGLNLQVPCQGVFACIGSDGSGKTTLTRVLSGLDRATAGECTVMGCSPYVESSKLHSVMGTVLDTAPLYRQMTLSENLEFFGVISGVDKNDAIDRSSFLMHKLDIWEGRDLRVGTLPTGVLRRASVARALMHRPQLLLMDEPAKGADREAVEVSREMIAYLVGEEGVTVFMSTTNTEFAQSVGNGFAFLQEGTVIAKGDLESLRKASGLLLQASLKLSDSPSVPSELSYSEGLWTRTLEKEEDMAALIRKVVESGCGIYEARVLKPDLKDIYECFLYGRGRKEGGTIGKGTSDDSQASSGNKPELAPEGAAGAGEKDDGRTAALGSFEKEI